VMAVANNSKSRVVQFLNVRHPSLEDTTLRRQDMRKIMIGI
jgi:hypothetical protein